MKNPVFLSLLFAVGLLWSGLSQAGIPATPVMTLYQFNGKRDLPYYEIESFRERGPSSPAGTLAQGTSLIPCLVIRDGQALTDRKGTPYVGFRILVDPRQATPAATDKFKRASARRKSLRVANHHCDGRVRHVIKILTQISGLTSCFLRSDLGHGKSADYYTKIRAIYEQNLDDVRRILFGNDRDLQAIFRKASLSDIKALRHYYHAPAMGKCFPNYKRVEYMSGAVARKGTDFALIANTRIQVGSKGENGYGFREFLFEEAPKQDLIRILDNYPGFEVDARKVSLKSPSACPPYGIPRGCNHSRVGRYRRTPPWLEAGKALGLQCKIRDRGANCRGSGSLKTVTVGGTCDTQMRPVTGVR